MEDVKVKQDPDGPGASPAGLDDEDVYEDAGDLEFNVNPDFEKAYLAKLPKYLWDAWAALDDDAEIQIGTVRQSNNIMPDGSTKTTLAMMLHANIAQHQSVPKEYILDVTNERVDNTFVFSEQDLPGFKSRSKQKFDLASANMPSRLSRAKNDKEKGPSKERFDPNKRFQPYFRKAIPKRTTLQARVAHEVNCIAVDNQESRKILTQRTFAAMQPKRHTKYISEDPGVTGAGYIQPGTTGASNTFKDFIRTKNPALAAREQKEKQKQKLKFARMPQDQLFDAIFACFKQYKYWSMKAFRAKLQQPESYLRETLEQCAVLAKSGRFASMWSLTQGYQSLSGYAVEEESAPNAEGAGGDEDSDMADGEDGDDEDVKFEDVVS